METEALSVVKTLGEVGLAHELQTFTRDASCGFFYNLCRLTPILPLSKQAQLKLLLQ